MKEYKSTIPEIQLKLNKSDVKKVKIRGSQDAADVIREIMDADTIDVFESVVILLLNRANNTTGWFKLSSGGLYESVIDIRLIFSVALKALATSIIIAHNHPTGNLEASTSDKLSTKSIIKGGELLSIEVLDHIIITSDGYRSMRDEADVDF